MTGCNPVQAKLLLHQAFAVQSCGFGSSSEHKSRGSGCYIPMLHSSIVRYQRSGLSNYGNQSGQEMFARGPSFPIQMPMETRLQLKHILSNANNWHVSSQFHDILVSIYNVIRYLVITLVGCILVVNWPCVRLHI
jgi:hypothetical protein